jgi:hypothetical protein
MSFLRTALNNIRLALAVLILVPILTIAAIAAAIEWWSGSGTLHVHPSPGEALSISIDGAPPEGIYPGQHFERELAQGEHRVAVSGPMGQSSFDLHVSSGMWEQLLPSSQQQCWVELDVYPFYYAPSRALPTVEARYPSTDLVSIGGGDYFDESALPRSVSEHSSVTLMQPIPCTMMQATDDQLLYGLGFQL